MTTDKYNLGDLSVATSGWDAIFDANMEKIDDAIATRDIRVAGETLAAYEVIRSKVGYMTEDRQLSLDIAKCERAEVPFHHSAEADADRV